MNVAIPKNPIGRPAPRRDCPATAFSPRLESLGYLCHPHSIPPPSRGRGVIRLILKLNPSSPVGEGKGEGARIPLKLRIYLL